MISCNNLTYILQYLNSKKKTYKKNKRLFQWSLHLAFSSLLLVIVYISRMSMCLWINCHWVSSVALSWQEGIEGKIWTLQVQIGSLRWSLHIKTEFPQRTFSDILEMQKIRNNSNKTRFQLYCQFGTQYLQISKWS